MQAGVDTWFAGKPGSILVFRVNRRYLPKVSLFAPAPLPAFEHFRRLLAPGWEVISGRRHQRIWKVGGISSDLDQELLVGKLGWLPRGETVVPSWSEEDQDWTSSVSAPAGGQVMPFVFDGESRILAVLHDPSSAPTSIARAFQKILQQNEAELSEPTTDWAVEPVLDKQEFIEWLASLEVVRWVSFTARLPNPEPMPEFHDLATRLEHRNAEKVTETMQARSDDGLIGVPNDPDFGQAIAMAGQGFASLRGKGHRDGKTSSFSQSDEVARERVEETPAYLGGCLCHVARDGKGSTEKVPRQ
jgi:hypothetical protein